MYIAAQLVVHLDLYKIALFLCGDVFGIPGQKRQRGAGGVGFLPKPQSIRIDGGIYGPHLLCHLLRLRSGDKIFCFYVSVDRAGLDLVPGAALAVHGF